MIDSARQEHIDFLIQYYDAVPGQIKDKRSPFPVLFEKISVFGEMPDVCVAHQFQDIIPLGFHVAKYRNYPPIYG